MKYRKKPVVIEARQYIGTNWGQIQNWINKNSPDNPSSFVDRAGRIVIWTLEGEMRADVDDWVIQGVKGEFYPCKPDIFEATYESVKT